MFNQTSCVCSQANSSGRLGVVLNVSDKKVSYSEALLTLFSAVLWNQQICTGMLSKMKRTSKRGKVTNPSQHRSMKIRASEVDLVMARIRKTRGHWSQ